MTLTMHHATNERTRRCRWCDKPFPLDLTRSLKNRARQAYCNIDCRTRDACRPPALSGTRLGNRDAIDEVAVLRACRGEIVGLHPAELAEAVRRLSQRGLSAAVIAERVGCSKRHVTRVRAWLRTADAA